MHRETNTRSRSRVFVLVAVVVLAGAAYWFFTEGPGGRILSPSGSTVAEFSGPGATETETFTVREGWQIHWDSQSDTFSLAIRGDRDFGTVVELDEPTSGITAPVGGGEFFLEISAEGDWSISVLQGDRQRRARSR